MKKEYIKTTRINQKTWEIEINIQKKNLIKKKREEKRKLYMRENLKKKKKVRDSLEKYNKGKWKSLKNLTKTG